MAVVYTNIGSTIRASKELDNLYKRNVGRGGQYKYVYRKMLKSGKFQVGLSKSKINSAFSKKL